MTSKHKKQRDEILRDQSTRIREFQRLKEKSEKAQREIRIPDYSLNPRERYRIPFPYGNDGEPLEWGSGLRDTFLRGHSASDTVQS